MTDFLGQWMLTCCCRKTWTGKATSYADAITRAGWIDATDPFPSRVPAWLRLPACSLTCRDAYNQAREVRLKSPMVRRVLFERASEQPDDPNVVAYNLRFEMPLKHVLFSLGKDCEECHGGPDHPLMCDRCRKTFDGYDRSTAEDEPCPGPHVFGERIPPWDEARDGPKPCSKAKPGDGR